ncbi:MAG: ABC-F family ATP-binding cassette domain-containing protein [Granulosicoccus sp.]
MKTLLNVLDVSFTRGSLLLFEDISFSINSGDRIGFVGHNGSGKSTLLSLLAGNNQPDDGEIRMPRGQRVALVEQFVPEELIQLTLSEAVLCVMPVEQRPDNRYQVDKLLQELGFSVDQTALPLNSLSGGQQNLALLARAILLKPELLLMDEPGNHMDVMALAFLQKFLLSGQTIPFLMISHDRELLNNCCTRTIFLRDKRLYTFDLPFDAATEALSEHDVQNAKTRKAEEKEIRRLQASARRLALWGKNYDNEDLARKAKSMQKRAERLKQEQTTVSKGSGLALQVQADALRAKSLLTIEDLVIATPDGEQDLLRIEFQHIRPGDRIALLGRNGIGKSTTINRLVSSIGTYDEKVRFNPNVNHGYYDQLLEQFSGSEGRFDWLRDRSDVADDTIQQVLLQNGIAFAELERSVKTLSGGECARLMFMLFQIRKPNFLILDEPTNHIDIQGREQLEQQLIDADTTLLITSHDRRFIERVANRWWWIHDKKLVELNGLDEFYAVVEQDVLQEQAPSKSIDKMRNDVKKTTMTEYEKLARIDELEKLLREDKARKKKFQKPDRHRLWEEELASLWKGLN